MQVRTLRAVALLLDVALDAATRNAERTPTFQFRVSWPWTGVSQNPWGHQLSDMTNMVQSITMTRELSSDLPPEVGFLEGTAATKVVVTLGGKLAVDGHLNPDGSPVFDLDTVQWFSPYGITGIPLINRPVELRTGFQTSEGPATLLQFTGRLSGYSPSAATREVQVDCLDPTSLLRASITQYAFGVDGDLQQLVGFLRYAHLINSQWMIDRILRANGFYASPPPGGVSNGSVILSATMHGSIQHEIGNFTYVPQGYWNENLPTVFEPTFQYGVGTQVGELEYHPFRMMFPRYGRRYFAEWLASGPMPFRHSRPDNGTPDGWGLSGWVRIPGVDNPTREEFGTGTLWRAITTDYTSIGGPVPPQSFFQVTLVAGEPRVQLSYPDGAVATLAFGAGNWTPPPVETWMFVGAHVLFRSDSVVLTLRVDDRQIQSTPAKAHPNVNVPYRENAYVYGQTLMPFTNFSVWYRQSSPTLADWRGATWTPTASIDPGINWLGGVHDIINRESYDLIKEIVAAEFGSFMFDETGKPMFRSRYLTRTPPREPEVLTSERDLSDLIVTVDEASIRNSIDWQVNSEYVQGWEVLWEPDDPYYFSLNANETKVWLIPLPEDCPVLGSTDLSPVVWIASELWGEAKDNPYYAKKTLFCASLLSDPTVDVWQAVLNGDLSSGGGIAFRIQRVDAVTARLTLYNLLPYGIRLATASKAGTDSSTGKRDSTMVTEGEPAFTIVGRKVSPRPPLIGSVRHERSIATYGEQTYDLGGASMWRQSTGAAIILSGQLLAWTGKPKPVLTDIEVPHNPRRKLYDKVVLTEPDSLGARVQATIHGISTTIDENGIRDTLTVRPDAAPPGW